MRIDIATIFPRMFAAPLGSSIAARAQEAGLASIRIHDLRDFTEDRHRSVDDYPYGGGAGMVMRPGPFFRLHDHLVATDRDSRPARPPSADDEDPIVVLFSPAGVVLRQELVQQLAAAPWLLLLCGHYEGIDERVALGLKAVEVSLGDFVLTGGELPAMVLVDAVVRQLPGVLGAAESLAEESFGCAAGGARLEYPHYTRPPEFRGMAVPDVLRSGDHAAVAAWRQRQSLRRTIERRPDLIERLPLTPGEEDLIRGLPQ